MHEMQQEVCHHHVRSNVYSEKVVRINGACEQLARELGTVTHDGVPTAKTTVILLETAKVMCSVETYNAEIHILFDRRKERSFIMSATSKRLGCPVVRNKIFTVGVFGGRQAEKMFQRVTVTLNTKQGRRFQLEVLETDVICDHKIPAPPQSFAHQLGCLDCDFADLANSDAPEDIGLLMGSEYIWGLKTGRTRKLGKIQKALQMVFGWCMQGPIEGTSQQNQCSGTVTLRTSVVEDKMADVLSKFWTLESIKITDKVECKPGECAAMEVFEQTLPIVDGRYDVALKNGDISSRQQGNRYKKATAVNKQGLEVVRAS
ncbi:hypothetical protein HPB48_017178 [Haemaphysalis longicornis]|uniref:Peptidase aspartic putative domain-containing protein n=1 Tax=Haemaphysalis longicornis TaxID=44386 RepID=A0A9J6FS21_HAELO|nr:hypothetical protein HPB48_017178 [Haemaphysalis longicornis]